MRLSCISFVLLVLGLSRSSLATQNVSTEIPSSATKQPHFTFDELYNKTFEFTSSLMFPANLAQVSLVNSTFFSDDIVGRIDDAGVFAGRELNTEYNYGIFSNIMPVPDYVSLVGMPLAFNITHFAANDNIVSVAAILDTVIPFLGIHNPVEYWAFLTFNAKGKINQYDIVVRRSAQSSDYVTSQTPSILGVNSTTAAAGVLQTKIATGVCSTAQALCNGTNVQYSDTTECFNFLTKEVRFGASYEARANTLLCRMLHAKLVPLRPEVHCPHIGPTGGGFCVDQQTYPEEVAEPVFTNAPFVPRGLQNPNATIAAE
jgi:hypothetical protein